MRETITKPVSPECELASVSKGKCRPTVLRYAPRSSGHSGLADCTGALANNKGMTLLETIVALAILAIGIVGVLHAFSMSVISTREAESYSKATMLASQVASELDRQTTLEAGEQSGTFEDEPNYSWNAVVESADDNGLMRTTITVTWNQTTNPRQLNLVVCLKPSGSETTETTSTPTGGSG